MANGELIPGYLPPLALAQHLKRLPRAGAGPARRLTGGELSAPAA